MWYRKRDAVPIPTSRFQERGKNMIRYELAEDIGARISDILRTLKMTFSERESSRNPKNRRPQHLPKLWLSRHLPELGLYN